MTTTTADRMLGPCWVRCGICGRFMSYADQREAVITARNEWALALDPPDDVYNHKACHEGQKREATR